LNWKGYIRAAGKLEERLDKTMSSEYFFTVLGDYNFTCRFFWR